VTAIYEAATVALGATTVAGAAATGLLARSRRALSRSRAELVERNISQIGLLAAAGAKEEILAEELRHLLAARLPSQALNLVSDHYPVPGLASSDLAGSEFAALLDAVQELFITTVVEERRRVDAAARAALRGACMEIQSKSYQLQTLVDALQRACEDEETLKDYFRIDHLNEQTVRLVQKVAIVAGAWPGLVRQDTHLPDLVTGATSRLHGFERIQVHSKLLSDNVGVVGRAAEPLAVACTELLANALESSRGDLAVEVTLLQTDNGSVCIQIDDAGKGMTSEEAARGARLLSGKHHVLLTELGDPPALGFAAIGQLVADHGFHVTVDQVSAYSGVRAVISIPPALLTTIDPEAEPLSAMAPLPAAAPRTPRRAADAPESAPGHAASDATGMPQRRRRTRRVATLEQRLVPEGTPPDPDQARMDWDAIERGLASGRADTTSDTGTDIEDNA
jgi:signal transduction histidine kinase